MVSDSHKSELTKVLQKPRDVRPEDWPAKDCPKQRDILEAYAEYERLEREALALRNFPRIPPDVAIPAMITKDGTRVTGKLAMEELAKPPWLRQAFVSFEGHSDEAEVTSFQENLLGKHHSPIGKRTSIIFGQDVLPPLKK